MGNESLLKGAPTILVLLGATGDLSAKKIIPSVYDLFLKNLLPERFLVMGYSRRNLSDQDFREHVKEKLKENIKESVDESSLSDFLNLFCYKQGTFEDINDYKSLNESLDVAVNKWGMCTNRLFYLAVPPKFYGNIFKHLSESGLTNPCGGEEGWSRIIVEKPFGNDFQSAHELDMKLSETFKEEQIYRIDHYLGKEMLQNISVFRFMNGLFERQWNKDLIESVEIKILESLDIEERGEFYDSVGALRDVGQNHLLQMLSLVAMEKPIPFTAEEVRKQRTQLLNSLRQIDFETAKENTFRAQYEGFLEVDGVGKESKTETYFKVKAFVETDRWYGVPFYLEAGKAQKETQKEIVVTLKAPLPLMCPVGLEEHCKNKIKFTLEPEEGMSISFLSRKPGFTMDLEPRELSFDFHQKCKETEHVSAYTKLLRDCILGDQTLFISTEEINALWKFIDPIIEAWQNNVVPLETYAKNSDELKNKLSL